MTDIERLNIIDTFKEQMAKETLTDVEKNELYKSIISHIVWDKKDDTYVIEVNFLQGLEVYTVALGYTNSNILFERW